MGGFRAAARAKPISPFAARENRPTPAHQNGPTLAERGAWRRGVWLRDRTRPEPCAS